MKRLNKVIYHYYYHYYYYYYYYYIKCTVNEANSVCLNIIVTFIFFG